MAFYSAVTKPSDQDSATVDLAARDSVAVDQVEPGGADCSSVLEWLRSKWNPVVLVLMILAVLLVVIIVVLTTLLVSITTQQSSTTTTQQSTATAPPLPLLSSIVGNDTAVLPPAVKEQVLHQLQVERTLPRCRMVNISIKATEVLPRDGLKEVLDGILLTHNIYVTRCQGLCMGHGLCQPMYAVNMDFVVLYRDSHGALQHIKRQIQHHRLCKCLDV